MKFDIWVVFFFFEILSVKFKFDQNVTSITDALQGDLRTFMIIFFLSFFLLAQQPPWARASSFTRFLDHTQRRITVGRPPLDEWSARRRDLYLTTQNTHNRQTSMSPVGFEPTISACGRRQNYALDRAGTGTGTYMIISLWILRRMRNGADQNCRENQNTRFMFINWFRRVVPCIRSCGKMC